MKKKKGKKVLLFTNPRLGGQGWGGGGVTKDISGLSTKKRKKFALMTLIRKKSIYAGRH